MKSQQKSVRIKCWFQTSTHSFYICTSLSAFHLWCLRDRPYNRTKRLIFTRNNLNQLIWLKTHTHRQIIYRFTSSALWAIKKPCVFAWILAPRGLMEILLSAPSSVAFISMASSSNFNFVKHNLEERDV